MIKIKICFISIFSYPLFFPKSKVVFGGGELDIFNVSRALSELDYFDISVVVGDFGQQRLIRYQELNLYRSFSLEKKILNYLIAPIKLFLLLKKLDADVYVCECAGVEVGITGLFCKLFKKKFIYRVAHDMDCSLEYVEKNGIAGIGYKFGLESASLVFSLTKRQKSKLFQNHKINSPVLNYGLQIIDGQNTKKDYILWVARCESWKNPDVCLKIAEKFSDQKFVMICPKQNDLELFEKIKRKSKSLSNLKFIERVSFKDSQGYFNKAKLFIGTSEYEGFPNTYIQSCIGSVPIISYKVNPDDFIKKHNLGYCSGGNIDLMMRQIENILSDTEDWKTKSKNAYKYAKENHDIKKVVLDWEAEIKKLINPK